MKIDTVKNCAYKGISVKKLVDLLDNVFIEGCYVYVTPNGDLGIAAEDHSPIAKISLWNETFDWLVTNDTDSCK